MPAPIDHRRVRRLLATSTALALTLTARPGLAQTAPASDVTTATAAPTEPHNGYAELLKPGKPRRLSHGAASARTEAAYTPIRATPDDGDIAEIEMFVGESRVFPAPGVARIAVGNGSLMSAAALDGREVILFANAIGTSSLFIWNTDGRWQRVKINIVPGDTNRQAREVAAFLSTIGHAKASIVGANIIVEGEDLSDTDLAKIDELGKRYPQIVNFTNRVGWEQMVAMDVKVVEFPTSTLRDVGLDWTPTGGAAVGGIWSPFRQGSNGPFQVDINPANGSLPVTSPAGSGAPVVLPSGLNVLSALNAGLNAQIHLLAQDGRATMLAQPQLSARSGSKATFLAGGEIPYTLATRDGLAVQFKSYGVKLDITPKVDHHGVIRATIHAEVSGIDPSLSTAGGPALLSRSTETEFNVRAGETIVLSGLLQRDTSTDISKVPLLGDVPVLGALFRSKRFQNRETELVVFVTPRLIDAQSAGNVARIERATGELEQRQGLAPLLPELGDGAAPAPVPSASAVPIASASAARIVAVADMAVPTGRTVTPAAVRPMPQATPRLVPIPAVPLPAGSDDGRPRLVTAAAPAFAASAPDELVGSVLPRAFPPFQEPVEPQRQRYRVRLAGLALHTTPDLHAEILQKLAFEDVVTALPQSARGVWTGVQSGTGEAVKRGWVATQWLQPLAGE